MPDTPHEVPLIEFFIDAFYRKAIDPTSELYLPKLIQGQTGPTYEPYLAGGWTPLNLGAGEGAVQVCAGVSEDALMIPTPGAQLGLSFEDVTITGISNVVLGVPRVLDDTVSASATFSTLAPTVAPTPMTVAGSFTLTQGCCPTADGTTCAGPSSTYEGRGTFTVRIASSSVAASALIGTTPDGKLLTSTVGSLAYAASADASNITLTADITSIPPGRLRDAWNAYAATILNSPEVRTALRDNIAIVLGQQSTLDSISTLTTDALQSLMRSQ
jgi:hypothetical protein